MSTATMARPGKRSQRKIDVLRTLKALTLHAPGIARRAWISADRIASALDVEIGHLAAPLAHAEAAGLIALRRTDEGRLSVKLERIAAPKVRRRPGPALNPIPDCDQAEFVLAVASSGSTSPTIESIAAAMGRDCWGLDVELADAINSGWLDPWPDAPEGPSVVLTPFAAERLGLAISSDYSKWIRIGQPDFTDDDPPRDLTESDVTSESGHSPFDDVADTIGTPPELAEEAEAAEDRAAELAEIELPDVIAIGDHRPVKRKTRGTWSEASVMSLLESECLDYSEELRIPRPNRLLGEGRIWPVMVPDSIPPRPWTSRADGPCPCCGGQPLGYRSVCLICDRSGVDLLLSRIRSPAPALDRKPLPGVDTVHTPSRLALAGGIG